MSLLKFAIIAALQFPHRRALRRNTATFAWLSTSLKTAQASRPNTVIGDGDGTGETDEEAANASGDGESSPLAPSAVGRLPESMRMDVAGIGGVVVGLLVILSVFMPWFGFLISTYGETAEGLNFTLAAGAEEFELPVFNVFFFIVLALGVLSVVSVGLHRAIAAIIAAIGLAVTLVSYIYVVGLVENEVAELSEIGVGVTAIPSVGCLLAGFAFLVMFILQLIPKADPTRGANAG